LNIRFISPGFIMVASVNNSQTDFYSVNVHKLSVSE
jgi:hypothetical protein